MFLARTESGIEPATTGASGTCPGCGGHVVAKCGQIKVWHWAHRSADCDAWSEPMSQWHLDWQQRAPVHQREVVMDRGGQKHRADVVLFHGGVLELQASHISAEDIAAREAFYGHMAWLYRCTWRERIEFFGGKIYGWNRRFRWKHAAPTQLTIAKPLFWDLGDEVWHVELERAEEPLWGWSEAGRLEIESYTKTGRIVGTIKQRWSVEDFARRLFPAAHIPTPRTAAHEERA